jgi:1-acyl-sn-glycerol-3-phosphate acyltransferase
MYVVCFCLFWPIRLVLINFFRQLKYHGISNILNATDLVCRY